MKLVNVSTAIHDIMRVNRSRGLDIARDRRLPLGAVVEWKIYGPIFRQDHADP